MPNFWETIETLFPEELKPADNANNDLEAIRKQLWAARERKDRGDIMIARWAERGAMEWQAECFEKLGRAVWTFYYGNKRKESDQD